jgi:hypothetical protein
MVKIFLFCFLEANNLAVTFPFSQPNVIPSILGIDSLMFQSSTF